MPKILLHTVPPHQQRLTAAIDDAYRRGGRDDAQLNALLIAKMALVHREASVAVTTSNEVSVEGVA